MNRFAMRTIGLIILFSLLPAGSSFLTETSISEKPEEWQKINFRISSAFTPTPSKNTSSFDTNQLKKSSWYATAIKQIEESEYEIKSTGKINEFASPNRKQNLRAFYTADRFTLEPRADDNWKLQLTLKGVYSGKKKIYSPQQDVIAVTEKNKIQFNYNNEFTVEYINSKEGVRQNFIINKQPDNSPSTLNIRLSTNMGWFSNQVHPKEIHFAKKNGTTVEKKITYNDLKVWDANNKELAAHFETKKNQIEIIVDVKNAVYPVTIDPLSTTPDSTPDDADQSAAWFGLSVAPAGDVNGDGYSDVIIGAYAYDDAGNVDEGRAFVYHGSATGLSATPNSTPDDADQPGAYFGVSVASAGDVNGDGYSDVIVGAYAFDDGPNANEGRAFVYYGSASGLSATPNSTPDDADQPNAQFGVSVACAGDVNGDGFSDVIIGAYLYDDVANIDEGRAFVYYGSITGLALTPINTPDDANQAGASFGVSVASAGDVNGDGYSDIIIGAPYYDDGFTDEGRAFVYYGSITGLSPTPNSTPDDADQANAYYGYSVASAGDVNGDGYSDVIIGAYAYNDGTNADEGRAFVYHGSATGLSTIPNSTPNDANQALSQFGISVACAGDINGDGYSDVIIGANQYNDGGNFREGRAFVYFGSATGLSAIPNNIPDDADQSNCGFGISVAPAGDVNGDGYSDVIIGANNYDDDGNGDEGRAFVYHGGPDGLSVSPINIKDDANQIFAQFGFSVASAGDINGDGYSDIIIGARSYDDGANINEGRAFVYHGSATGLSATPDSTPDDADQANAAFGFSVAAAGDVNGDGYGDVIIGAFTFDDGANTNEGQVFVYHGSPTGLSATPNSTLDDADQANAWFGASVASAGDVNGDGYCDVIIGASGYDDGANTDEGRAFVYYGSSTGLSVTPDNTPDDADQATANFGLSVASAGDINGDGYSDVIIGAWLYDDGANTDEGRAFVYHGSATGLSAIPNSTPDDADQIGAELGYSVASAGDVNGDGYGDVIIGARLYNDGTNTDEGRAFVYYGSTTGLSAIPNSTFGDANQANTYFGGSVAAAGDVNGDGYCDVIIGANAYDDGVNVNEGRAFVYYGSAIGLSVTPNRTYDDANQANAEFGISVSSAGDVNGDGYSDVIIGAYAFDDGANTDEGRAFIYYGNNTGGLRNNLRLYNSDLVTPIQQSNMADPNLFGAGLYAKSFIGKQKGKLVWQTVKNGNPFTGIPITNSTAFTSQQASFTDLGLTGIELKNVVAKQIPAKATYIRTRVKYDLVTAITGQVYGPWRYPEGFLRGRRDIGAVILPVKFISFNALKQDKSALLKWITVDEEPGVRFEVQHSIDGITFTTLTTINGKNQTQNEYEWLHANPAKGNNFYRIRAVENQKEAYTATRKLNFSEAADISMYPNPAVVNQALNVQSVFIKQNQPLKISFTNNGGQIVWQKEMLAATDGKIVLNVPDIPAGAYLLLVQARQWTGNEKIVIIAR